MPLLRKGISLLLCLFGLLSTSFAWNVHASGPTLFVNEVPVLKFLTPTVTGIPPTQRIERLAALMRDLLFVKDIKAVKEQKTHVIFIDKVRIFTITPQEAARQGTSTAGLARQWVARLQAAYALPALKLSADRLRLPSPSNKFVKIVGSVADVAVVSTDNEAVASVRRVDGGLQIQANSPGDATISVAAADALQTIDVIVRPWAAQLPQTLSATVSGLPAMASTVKGAIDGAIQTQLQTVPGARVSFKDPVIKSMTDKSARTYSVHVTVSGDDAFERSGRVNVVVRNLGLPFRKESELWYSNDPENVRQAGPLFSSRLKQGNSARLLYHHINAASVPMYVRVQAVNDTDTPAKLMLIPGDSQPDKNPVRAGMSAAKQYFKAWACASGEVVTIPPQSTLPISIRRLSNGETSSGLCGLRLLEGPADILVRTDAWPPFNLERRWVAAVGSNTPWREVGTNPINDFDRAPYIPSEHIYPDPFKTEQVDYSVGGRYGFVRIGQAPIARSDNAKALDGNFGVIYNIRASVQNHTQEPTDVEVVFESSAGYSGGLFLLNGQMVTTPLMPPKRESRLTRFKVDPGASRKLDILTLPLSGSSYPATITIRPVQALGTGFTSVIHPIGKE